MAALSRSDLWSLEEYAEYREAFRAQTIAHKRLRQVHLGDHLSLSFEDQMTIRYQVQEMLRIERIFEREAIEEELSAYNPLIPDGQNLKATMMIEFDEVSERREALVRLKGVEDRIWMQVGEMDRVFAIADEDLDRANDEKTSAVHFLRFEFTPEMCAAAHDGAAISAGVDHPEYQKSVSPLPAETASALVADFAA